MSSHIRPKTPDSRHPVRVVREKIGMTQKELGVALGCGEQHIRNVENGKPVSRRLSNRIFMMTGAIIEDDKSAPLAFLGSGEYGPFTKDTYLLWLNDSMWESITQCDEVDHLLACLNYIFTKLREPVGTGQNRFKADLMFFELKKHIRRWIKEFALASELRNETRSLSSSGYKKNEQLADSLRDVIGPCDLATFWVA